MVGEIRDTETATIAVQAAQTGHLVLSTLHTNSASETMTRLQAMGIANYHLQHSLSLIIAQRLVRMLCSHCKQPEMLSLPDRDATLSYRPIGCEHCYQGYRGRTAIFEFLPMPTHTQHEEISLHATGWEKVQQGITSYAELLRVLGS